MDRVRSVAYLTPLQASCWHRFKEWWDAKRAEVSGTEWGVAFAQEMRTIQCDLLDAHSDALSKFMEDERERILNWDLIRRTNLILGTNIVGIINIVLSCA